VDPHLHSHCILFNATKDSVENRWKALETYAMLQAKKFTENVYALRESLHEILFSFV
jgi:hypothetical protein